MRASVIPTKARLWLAVLSLCLAPTSDKVWQGIGFVVPGTTLYGDCGSSSGGICTPDMYTPGYYIPGSTVVISQAAVRILVVIAIAAFITGAVRPRTFTTRRIARVGTCAVAFALMLALGRHDSTLTVLLGLALFCAAPPVWRATPVGPGRALASP